MLRRVSSSTSHRQILLVHKMTTMASTQLPHLPDVERVSPRVIRILGGNPGKFTLQGTNTYLIGTGRSRLLLDTAQGLPHWRETLASVLSSENCTVSSLLLTHWHHDHVGGVADLLELCPSANLLKHPGTDVQRAVEVAASQYGMPRDSFLEKGRYESISDGQVFRVEGAALRAVHCPGHTTDHTAFVFVDDDSDDDSQKDAGALFSGDAVLGHGTAVFEDLPTYLNSLNRLHASLASDSSRIYPAHGAVIPRGRAKVAEYLAHRRKREDEILAVLSSEAGNGGAGAMEKGKRKGMTPAQIVKVVYKDTPPELHLPAEGGVRKVLAKLKDEGRVHVLEDAEEEEGEGGRWYVNGNGNGNGRATGAAL